MYWYMSDRVKIKAILMCLLLSLVRSQGLAGQLDPRFDGIWSGTELIQGHHVREQLGGGQTPGRVSALIGISDSGMTFGVLRGLTPGRYDVSPKSNGNTLIFGLHDLNPKGTHNPFFGRTKGKVILSDDGDTLTETASAILPGTPHPIYCVIAGSFHRQRKK